MQSGVTRTVAAIALSSTLALSVAACGGSSSASSAASSSKQEDARLAAAKCMRQHGVPIPDPGQERSGGGARGALQNIPEATRNAARQACQKYFKNAFGQISAADRTRFRDAFVKYSACMRSHGINIPTPAGAGPGGGGPGRFEQLRQQPGFQAANDACRKNLPQRRGFGRGLGAPGGL